MNAVHQHPPRILPPSLPVQLGDSRRQPGRGLWHERPTVHVAVLLAWSLFLFGLGIDRGDLYRNETLRAYLAQEMMNRGELLVPHLHGEPLLTKPPLAYWLTVVASVPQGKVTAASARIPSAVLATLVLLAVYAWFRRHLPGVQSLLLALLLPCFPLWLAKAPSAEIDFHLLAFVTFAILLADCWLAQPHSKRASKGAAIPFSCGFALCLAAGTLTKWTAGIYIYVTLIALLWWRGCLRRLLQVDHLFALAGAIAVVVVWFVAVVQQIGWSEVAQQLWQEAAPRLLPAEHQAQHPEKLLWLETAIHPLKVLACAAPLGVLAPLTLRRRFLALQEPRRLQGLELLHSWAWPNLLLFTLLPEHASRHSLPICPPLVLLGGYWLLQRQGFGWRGRWPQPSPVAWAATLLALWFTVKLSYVEVIVPARDAKRQTAAKAQSLAQRLDFRQPLLVCQLKDEGLAFYCRHQSILRVRNWHHARFQASQVLLTASEWEELRPAWQDQIEFHIPLWDSQGDTIHLVKLLPPHH